MSVFYDVPFICPATGHTEDRYAPLGALRAADAICPRHGVPLFRDCPVCGSPWPMLTEYGDKPTKGANFCRRCASPAPWLTRDDLIGWLQAQIEVASDIPATTRLELRELLDRLQRTEADDERAAASWQRVRDAAPQVWAATKTVRNVLMSEGVKKLLDLL